MRVLNGKVLLIFITPENIVENSIFRNMLLSKTFKEKLVALMKRIVLNCGETNSVKHFLF